MFFYYLDYDGYFGLAYVLTFCYNFCHVFYSRDYYFCYDYDFDFIGFNLDNEIDKNRNIKYNYFFNNKVSVYLFSFYRY